MADSPVLLPCERESASETADAIRALLTCCRSLADDGNSLLARLCLALEEMGEWVEAHDAGDLVAAADAWGDRLYVLLGDAVAAGLPAAAVFEEVHRSNMTKTAEEGKVSAFRAPARDTNMGADVILFAMMPRASRHVPSWVTLFLPSRDITYPWRVWSPPPTT